MLIFRKSTANIRKIFEKTKFVTQKNAKNVHRVESVESNVEWCRAHQQMQNYEKCLKNCFFDALRIAFNGTTISIAMNF